MGIRVATRITLLGTCRSVPISEWGQPDFGSVIVYEMFADHSIMSRVDTSEVET